MNIKVSAGVDNCDKKHSAVAPDIQVKFTPLVMREIRLCTLITVGSVVTVVDRV